MKAGAEGRLGVRLLLVTLGLLVASFAGLIAFAYRAPSFSDEVSLDRVYEFAERGEVRRVKLLDEDALVIGERCFAPALQQRSSADSEVAPAEMQSEDAVERSAVSEPCPGPTTRFQASYPSSDVATQRLIETIKDAGGRVVVDKQVAVAVAKLLTAFVFPLLLLAVLFGLIFLSKGGDSSIADIAGFGTIRRKRQRKRHAATAVTFADVAGAGEAVAELREVIDYLRDPAKFEAYGAAPPKGVLLFGPPGCGKTLLARAVAGESGVPFFAISGAEFVESLVGVGAARVRDLFRQVREEAPAIVFIDEIDAVGRRRSGEGLTGGEREQTVNQLLVELDGFDVTSGIVLMGATNRPDILDPALLRPGRFDRHVTLDPPDVQGRREILKLHARGKPVASTVDFELLARRTPGFTGADLANVINESALLTIREGHQGQIEMAHLGEATLRVLHGPQRRGRLMRPEERKRLAVHEAGHAVAAAALGQAGDIHRVSIVARGRGLGQLMMAEEGNRMLLTASDMEERLAVVMAGVAAEVLVFGESSTTAEDDIYKATSVARAMVGLYGMSPEVGRVRLLTTDDGYLGGDTEIDAASAQILGAFDQEVKRLIGRGESNAAALLTSRRLHLDQMAELLQEHETLEGEALEGVLSAVRPARQREGSARAAVR